MKRISTGFIIPLLIIIVAILAIGGIFYIFKQYSVSEPITQQPVTNNQPVNNQPNPTPTGTIQQQITALVQKMATCSVDSDCTIAPGYLCGSAVNKNSSSADLAELKTLGAELQSQSHVNISCLPATVSCASNECGMKY